MKIGIVNDLPIAVENLRRALALRPEHSVAWIARDGFEAVIACTRDRPDLVLMDLMMPTMDGVEATRRIMAASPCAILVVTVSVDAHAGRVFEAMGAGALDAVDTPALGVGDPRVAAMPLLAKIDSIARLVGRRASTPIAATRAERTQLVCIGASAGGPAALALILAALPPTFKAPLVLVQHVDAQFASSMAQWLDQQCAISVRIAEQGDRPERGVALLAATNDHLVFDRGNRLAYTVEPRNCVYRPSVDALFHSVCERWRGEVLGVLLTGMGKDGAAGLKALRNKGHYTIAQDQATSAVYGMPKAAAALHAAVDILPLSRIAARLIEVCHQS